MSTPLRVDLFGTQCNTDVPDANGCVWTVKPGIEGWTSPGVVSERGRVSVRNGTTLLDERHTERVLVVRGMVFAPDQDTAWDAYNQLNLMPPLGASGQIVVHEAVPKQLTVRQAEAPYVPRAPMNARFDYELNLVALQPYKTATTAKTQAFTAGASHTLANDGTAPAYLTVTTTGSGTVRLVNGTTGQELTSLASVASGTVFNGDRRRVFDGSGAVLRGVCDPISEWLSIALASSAPLTNEGSAPVLITWYDSYA